MRNKEFIITTLFIISILIIYGLFPVKNSFQQLVVMTTFFVFIPIIFNKVFLKNGLGNLGFKIGDWKQGLIWSGICLAVAGLLFFLAAYFFGFLKHYTVPDIIIYNYKNFLFYEFMLVLPVVFMYDFFFRGFITLNLGDKLHYWVIVAQALLFLILILATKSFVWGLIPYLISAPLAGIITYKSRSIFYSTALQFVIILLLDANFVRLIK